MELYERLKLARLNAGYHTAKDAATRLGVPYGTYTGHESGSRGIKNDELERYARAFDVSLFWLTYGIDNEVGSLARQAVYIGEVNEYGSVNAASFSVEADDAVKFAALPLRRTLQCVLEVKSHALVGYAPPGSYLYLDADPQNDIEKSLDNYAFCNVFAADAWRGVIGIPSPAGEGLYNIERLLLPTLKAVPMKAAMPVMAVVMKRTGDQMRDLVAPKSLEDRDLKGRLDLPRF